ncbi:MAG: DUF2232 domain-containing protein [Halanaerobiaceae bacterium]
MDVQKDVIKDTIKTIAEVLFLSLLLTALPFFALVIVFILPAPVALLIYRRGPRPALIAVVLSAVLNGLLLGPRLGLLTIVLFGFSGFITGGCIREDVSPFKTLLSAVGAVSLSYLVIVLAAYFVLGYDINSLVSVLENREIIEQFVETFPNIFGSQEELLAVYREILTTVIPSLLLASAAFTGIINYYFASWYINYREGDIEIYKPMRFWSFPRVLVIGGILLSFIFAGNVFFNNVNILMSFLLFLQGIGTGLFFLHRQDGLLVKWLSITLVIFLPYLLILLGLVDLVFDLRKLSQRRRNG